MPPKIRKEGAEILGMGCGVGGDRVAVMTRKPGQRRLRSFGAVTVGWGVGRREEGGEKAYQAGDDDGWMGLSTGYAVGRETVTSLKGRSLCLAKSLSW